MTSLLRQKLPDGRLTRVDIIVVDDGSPVAARGELDGLNIAAPFRLRLTEQPNAGVAAARNTALAAVADDTTYIAFLDSDDIWDPDHLATSIDALERGYDFYFCDGRRINCAATSFTERITEPSFATFLDTAAAHIIGDRLYEVEKEPFFSKSLRVPGYRIPAVVYRRSAAPELVFEIGLREVGEDSLFLLQLIARSRKICCSSRELALFADGVNIFASKFSWDNPGHLMRYFGTILYYNRMLETLPLSKEDAAFATNRRRMYRRLFAFLTVRYFLKKREPWPRTLVDLTRSDRRFWLWYPAWVLYVSATYPLRLYDPVKRGDVFDPGAARA
jgi:succinoglycan biosynthesis protein ExoW